MATDIDIKIPGMDRFSEWYKRATYSSKKQQSFLEDVYTLVEDGVPANKAIEAVGVISTGINAEVAKHVMDVISQGKPIANGLKGWYPPYIVELIRAGEEGGTLAETMRSASEALGQKNQAFSALFAALVYPLVVVGIGVGVLFYLNKSVFAQFKEIKPISTWPPIGQKMVGLANYIESYGIITFIGLVLLGWLLMKLVKNYTGQYRFHIDKVPVLSLYKVTTAARFMETLGLLIGNGVVFKKGLELMTMQASPYLTWHLMMMEKKLGMGRANIAEVLDTGMIAGEDIVRLQVTAASKGFEHALVRLGHAAARSALKTVTTAANILGGILLALGACLAGAMVLAIYSVGFSLAG